MTLLYVLAIALSGASLRQSIPLPAEDAAVFLAAPSAQGVPAVCVLDDGALYVYPLDAPGEHVELTLPEGTALFDVAPVDAAREHTVIMVRGAEVLRKPLRSEAPVRRLFELDEPIAASPAGPLPFPLTLRRNERLMLALPSGDALQLRDFSGQPVEDQPEPLESASVFESRDFMTWPAGPGRIGGPGALEVMVRRQRTRKGLDVAAREGLDDAAPEDALFSALFAEAPDIMRRAGACGLIAERGGQEYLAVITSGKVSPRDSSVRIAQVARGGEGANPSVRMGPPRRYPGRLARAAERPFAWGETPWPDFDGDGFADLLLWKAPLPGRSVDSMAEAVTGGSWPVRLTAHLFSPGKGRYEPRPAGRIEARLPVWRLLDLARGAPLRHAVFDDLDGDGGDDCAFATDVDRYGVWLFGDGFAATPSASYAFSSVIAGIEYAGPLGPGRASAILLRTRRAVHVLEPGRD